MRPLTFLLIALLCAGCEKCAPGLVAKGVSQLTARNFGAIVSHANERCGIEEVTPTLEGNPGEQGAAEWRVDDCVLELEAATETDCRDVVTRSDGKVTVTMIRRIEGYLTGDPSEPVIPSGPDAVSIQVISAVTENFKVESSNSSDFMVNLSGELSGILKPRLGASDETGVCSIPTKDITMEEIVYRDALVRVVTKSRDFQVPIATSNLGAAVGQTMKGENEVFGEVTVWEKNKRVKGELDPDYEPDLHLEGFACTEDLAQPLSYEECVTDIRPLIAQGASQLAVQMIGRLASYLDEDPQCGFGTVDPVIEGNLGERGGSATWTVAEPCEVVFPQKTVIHEDCEGKKTYAEGRVLLTGTKRLEGFVSGDPVEPIVPTRRDPARVAVVADLDNFALWTDPEVNKLTVLSGRLSTETRPRVAIDDTNGACSVVTPISQFSAITYEDASLVVESEGRRFEVFANSSSLEAQNGQGDERTNYLAGTITLDGESFDIPTGSSPVLDPDYDQATFDRSHQCEPNVSVPKSDADCDMTKPLGEGAMRLLVLATGQLASLTNSNNRCGFARILVLVRPDEVVGEPGELGSMTWSIEDCSVGQRDPFETDCVGTDRYGQGGAYVTASRTVTGLREKLLELGGFGLIDSIIPDSHQSVTINFDQVELEDFSAYDLKAGEAEPARALTIERGFLSAVVHPITGLNAAEENAYDVQTKVASFSNIRISDAPVVIFFEGKTFNVTIDEAEVNAFNGSFADAGRTNWIDGRIVINGREIRLIDEALDPEYDQAAFDDTYVCVEDLAGLIPPAP